MGDILANAATLTSLVLGVVAIFYSFVSNDALARGLGSLTTVESEIRESRDAIEQFVEITQSNTTVGKESAALLETASSGIETSLEKLHVTLTSIAEQNKTLQAAVVDFGPRMDQRFAGIEKTLGEKVVNIPEVQATTRLSDEVARQFFTRPALSYDLLIYACVLAHAANRELSLAALCEAINIKNERAMSGFMAAANALDLIEREFIPDKPRVYKIVKVHPVLRNVKDYIPSYLARAYANEPEERQKWTAKVAALEALFSV